MRTNIKHLESQSLALDLERQHFGPGLGVSWRCSQPLKVEGLGANPVGLPTAWTLLALACHCCLHSHFTSPSDSQSPRQQTASPPPPLPGRVQSTSSPHPIKHAVHVGTDFGPLGSWPEMCLRRHMPWKVPVGGSQVCLGPCVRFTTFHETHKVSRGNSRAEH